MPVVVFDIETIPTQDPRIRDLVIADAAEAHEKALAAVRAPSNYRDEVKIAAYVEETRARLCAEHEAAKDAALRTTSLDGIGQIVVIGYAVDDAPVRTIAARDLTPEAEAEVLTSFFAEIHRQHRTEYGVTLVGHNIVDFDLPFIWRRAMLHGMRPPPCIKRNVKPWDDRIFDTMREWAGQRGTIKLTKLARVLGFEPTSTDSGADIRALVEAGRIDDVAAKCASDVEMTRQVFRRMTFASPA